MQTGIAGAEKTSIPQVSTLLPLCLHDGPRMP